MRRFILAAATGAALLLGAAAPAFAASDGPTCSTELGGYPHGYHIIADYVTGVGSELLGGPGIEWPPTDLNAAGGAALPGGPGPAFHFVIGVAPGASFCTDSNSPGVHF